MTNEELNNYFNEHHKLEGEIFDDTMIFQPNLQMTNPSLTFENCHFFIFQFLNYSNPNLSVRFINCHFHDDFESLFKEISCDKLIFEDCEIGFLTLFNSRFNSSRIKNGCISGALSVDGIKGKTCEILLDEISGDINFHSDEVDYVKVRTLKSTHVLNLAGFKKCSVEGIFQSVFIACSDFEFLHFSSNYIGHKKSYLDSLIIANKPIHGRIMIDQFVIDTINLTNISGNDSKLAINETLIRHFNYRDSNLDELSLNQVVFDEPPLLRRSNLKGLTINNVKWPNHKKLRNTSISLKVPLFYRFRKSSNFLNNVLSEKIIVELKYEKDTYRQLKLASKENQNINDYLLFGMYEKRLHWKVVRIEGGEQWYDYILLFFERHISNFGYTWWIPLMWLLTVHLFLFSCIWEFNYWENHLSGSEEFGQYLFTLNPVHKSPPYIALGWGNVTEFFMRVLSAYFIYHFIKATRKFARN